MSHTNFESEAFWEVQLTGDFSIDRIVVYNRTDCCTDRIDPFRVVLFDGVSMTFVQEVGSFVADISAANVSGMTFDLTGQIGDRVRVQLSGQSNWLHLAEVEVFDQAIIVTPPPTNGTPEPASLALLALGLAGLALRRRRR